MNTRQTFLAIAVLATLALTGCQSTIPSDVTHKHIVGELWSLDYQTRASLKSYELSERMMNLAQKDCQTRHLIAAPVRATETDSVVDGKTLHHIHYEYRCAAPTGYQAPYQPLMLWFNSDEAAKNK